MKEDQNPLVTPELLLHAYASGIFPMSESESDPDIFWVEPPMRGILPLDQFHISKSLRRALNKQDFQVTLDTDFTGVVQACADRPETWINAQIFDLYSQLHEIGYAHSIEIRRDQSLIGGVYGVALGGAFFGESMFSNATNGSKIALAYLCNHLHKCGFTLFDTQFITPHLASLGAQEISKASYQGHLAQALKISSNFKALDIALKRF